jgi:hypothetical protein
MWYSRNETSLLLGACSKFPQFHFFRVFPPFFPAKLKQNGKSTPYRGYLNILWRIISMRQNRDLAEHVWYGVETAINVGEPLFRLSRA